MSNHTVEQLLAWMNDRSRTQGWSAVVAYDKAKANQLLAQLYIDRFGDGSFLPPLSEKLPHGEGAVNFEHAYDLTFAAPEIHFETASLDDSQVTVTLDFVGGMIISEFRPSTGSPRIDRVQKLLPLNRPQLTMSVQLDGHDGQVGEDGGVTLDISKGTNHSANFVVGSLSQADIGDRFKLYFNELVDEGKVLYPLGTLAGENGVLTPESFALRTMPAPGATLRESKNYKDGAILLFVKLREGTADGIPVSGSDFMYPLPVARNGTNYSGVLWLSNRTLMEKLIKDDVQADIGYGITFKPFGTGDSSDIPWPVTAISGALEHKQLTVRHEPNDDTNTQVVELTADWNYRFATSDASNKPLTITTKGNRIDLTWQTSFKNYYKFKRREAGWWDNATEGYMQNTSGVQITLAPELDKDGVVHFKEITREIYLSFKCDWKLSYFFDNNYMGTPLLNNLMRNAVFPKFESALDSISLPSVDTFLVRNLLFPGHNALRPVEVHVPGDLVLLGNIDPQRTSTKVTPLQPTVEAGGTQVFKTEPALTGVTWSVRATDDDDVNIGTIDANGLYKAAPVADLVGGYQRVVVTAKGKLNGQDVTSSAMVSVVETTVSVSPQFQVCDFDEGIYILTAETLSGEDPEWSLKDPSLGGKLSISKGRECIYTPPKLLDPERPDSWVEIIQVKNPDTQKITEAVILVINFKVNAPVTISKDSKPETGKLQVQVVSKAEGPQNPDAVQYSTRMVMGPGSITAGGVYTEPANASGIAVVAVFKGPPRYAWNYIVMPLPLATYGKLIMDVVAVIDDPEEEGAS